MLTAEFHAYCQRDPRWADVPLGFPSETNRETIGSAGCLLCCIASATRLTPPEMNEWLKAHRGYAHENLFVFASVEPLGLHLDAYIDCPYPQDTPVERIEDTLKRGGVVIGRVDFDPRQAGVQQHWIRVLKVKVDALDAKIYDPWRLPPEGLVVNTISDYGESLRHALWSVALYSVVQPVDLYELTGVGIGEREDLIYYPV